MLLSLAYGEFQSFHLVDMFFATLPYVLKLIAIAMLVYAPSSAIAGYAPPRWRWTGLALYGFGFAVLAPAFLAMGSFGPAHVGLSCGILAFPLFGAVLLSKTAFVYWRGHFRVRQIPC